MANTSFNDTYQLNDSVNLVILHVTIGYAQIGATGVSVNGIRVSMPPTAVYGTYTNSFDLVLGTNHDLANALLKVSAAVERIQPAETRTSILISLSGGVVPCTFPLLSANANSVGDVIDYLGLITFN